MTKEANGAGPDLIVLGRGQDGKPFPTGHDGLRGQGRQSDEPGRLQGRR
jgi:hypothetical protein